MTHYLHLPTPAGLTRVQSVGESHAATGIEG
jgi:hypothetical protein